MIENNNIDRRDFIQLASAAGGAFLAAGCGNIAGQKADGIGQSKNIDLRFNDNGKFKILQFTDTHWLDGSGDDIKTAKLMSELIEFEQPDMVIITGDVISGKEADSAKGQRGILSALASNKVPWAIVFGNHDDEGSCSRDQLWDIAVSTPYSCCPAKVADISGVSNYVLEVKASDSDAVGYALFMIDSNGYSPVKEIEGYGWIMPDQVEWFRANCDKYIDRTGGGGLPSLAFYHIPLPEYKTVVEKKQYKGQFNEDVCSPDLNSGFFAAVLEKGNVKGMFVGHDHVNDYVGELAGVKLCYGRKTGFRSYSQDGFAKGGRVIELTECKDEFDTWVVVEGCERVRY